MDHFKYTYIYIHMYTHGNVLKYEENVEQISKLNCAEFNRDYKRSMIVIV